jgi:hypothetical protein
MMEMFLFQLGLNVYADIANMANLSQQPFQQVQQLSIDQMLQGQ